MIDGDEGETHGAGIETHDGVSPHVANPTHANGQFAEPGQRDAAGLLRLPGCRAGIARSPWHDWDLYHYLLTGEKRV
jgi:hypothetical protein